MSYQTSKTAGDLWVSLVYVTVENEKIDGFASLVALILGEAETKKLSIKENTPEYNTISDDIQELKEISEEVEKISMKRDMTMTAINYPWIITQIYKNNTKLLKIALKHKLIEFSDGARFAGYGGDL